MKTWAFLVLLAATPLFATDADNRQLYALLNGNAAPQVQADAVRKLFNARQLGDGSAVAAYMGDFVWAIEVATRPELVIDDKPPVTMRPLPGNLWVFTQQVATGRSHAHYYQGTKLARRDTAAYTEDSYARDGVARGKLSEMLVCTSQVYRGHQVSYWIYASPGVDPAVAAPLMVWQDGEGFANPRSRLPTVVENLVQQKKIPPMVLVLIAPGLIKDDFSHVAETNPYNRMRSILYDTVNDDYNKMVMSEILPEVEKRYKLRADGYSRGSAGQSSGGICAFNMAWWRTDAFSRVITRIGSFTALQWHHGQANPNHGQGLDDPSDMLDGGYIYPFLVRQRDRKNIRVWMDSGTYDNENFAGSWPAQNVELANSLKMKEYDFHFSFGNQGHSTEHGNAELPQVLTWLWRGYDPSKTSEIYSIEAEEKDKPLFRVAIVNR